MVSRCVDLSCEGEMHMFKFVCGDSQSMLTPSRGLVSRHFVQPRPWLICQPFRSHEPDMGRELEILDSKGLLSTGDFCCKNILPGSFSSGGWFRFPCIEPRSFVGLVYAGHMIFLLFGPAAISANQIRTSNINH